MLTRALPVLDRPRTRGDCIDGPRPCPWVDCRHHLLSEEYSCVLDVADEGWHTQQEVASILGVSQQRVDFIEKRARRRALKRHVR
jgi:hypothetical protein